MVKYVNNGFLVPKVSLINDIENIPKEYRIDDYEVADTIGFDGPIRERLWSR